MRLRLISATVAAAALASLALTATPSATAATTPGPMVFGLTSKWVQNPDGTYMMDTERDELQISSSSARFRSGVISTFLPWRPASGQTQAAKTRSVVNWANWVHNRGAAPIADFYPPTNVTLGQMAAGSEDTYLKALAAGLKGFGHPIMFRLFPEHNGMVNSYCPGKNGQTNAQFKAAWIRIFNIFKNAGATNVKFMWNPNRLQSGQTVNTYKASWPGAAYVHWVGLDAYAYQKNGYYEGPHAIFKPSVDALRTFTTKPLIIAETGVNPYPNKAGWLKQHLAAHQALGAKISVYFNMNIATEGSGVNWRFDTAPDPAGQKAAMRTALAGPNIKYPGKGITLWGIDYLITNGKFYGT
jgi:hypothetical protein